MMTNSRIGLFETKDDQKKQPAANQVLDMKFEMATDVELQKLVGEDYPDGYIAGWASTPDLDIVRDVVPPSAFKKSIAERGLTGPKGVKLLIQHDTGKPAGKITVLKVDNKKGLWIEGQLNLQISYVRDYWLAAKDQGGMSFSIGYRIKDMEEKLDADGRPYWVLTELDLKEVSVVTNPANEEAVMTFIKMEETDPVPAVKTIAEFEKALIADGLVESRNAAQRLTRAVKDNMHLWQSKEPPVQATDDLKALSELAAKLNETFGVTEAQSKE